MRVSAGAVPFFSVKSVTQPRIVSSDRPGFTFSLTADRGDSESEPDRRASRPATAREKTKLTMRGIAARVSIYAAVAVGLACYAGSPTQVGIIWGHSMEPTLHHGQIYTLDRAYYRSHRVERGEVVVFRRGGRTFIKRVVAAPGDEMYVIRSTGQVQDELVYDFQMPYLRAVRYGAWRHRNKLCRLRVPAGFCYVVGDNLEDSEDSRCFGLIPISGIIGRPRDKVAPFRRLQEVAFVRGLPTVSAAAS